jgi:hypothetical protein
MIDRLDTLLSRPLGEPADSGFTSKTMLRIIDAQERADGRIAIAYAVATAAVLAALPFVRAGRIANEIILTLARSQPLAAAALVLILTMTAYRIFREA